MHHHLPLSAAIHAAPANTGIIPNFTPAVSRERLTALVPHVEARPAMIQSTS